MFREFQINVERDSLLSRCSKCNGEFIDRCAPPLRTACNQRPGLMQRHCRS